MINKVSFPYVFALIISVEATNVTILMESNFLLWDYSKNNENSKISMRISTYSEQAMQR